MADATARRLARRLAFPRANADLLLNKAMASVTHAAAHVRSHVCAHVCTHVCALVYTRVYTRVCAHACARTPNQLLNQAAATASAAGMCPATACTVADISRWAREKHGAAATGVLALVRALQAADARYV